MDFRWNPWNSEHATRHGVSEVEAESVVRNAKSPYPRQIGEEKWQVVGRGRGGRFMQVIYLIDPDGCLFIIHAMPLTTRRRRGRR